MDWLRAATVVAMLALVAPWAAGQQQTPYEPLEFRVIRDCPILYEEAKAQQAKRDGTRPFAVLAIYGSLTHDCRFYAFHATPTLTVASRQTVWTYWVSLTRGGPMYVNRATSKGRDCQSLVEALNSLAAVPRPALQPPGFGKSHEALGLDGETFVLWTNEARYDKQGTDFDYNLEFSGWSDTPLAAWSATWRRRLDTCMY